MARRRMIVPEIWQSESFAQLSILAKLVFIGLFSNADDEGRGIANPVYIKSILFPYDDGMRGHRHRESPIGDRSVHVRDAVHS